MFPRESPYLPLLKLILVLLACMLLVTETSWGWWVLVAAATAFLAALLAALAIMFVSVARFHYLGRRADKHEAMGVVLRKWTRSYDYDVPAPMLGGTWLGTVLWLILRLLNHLGQAGLVWTVYSQFVFWVVFEVEGEEVEFAVPEDLYISLDEGMAGVVCYRGPKLVEFRPMPGWQGGTALGERHQEVESEEGAGPS
ncbi:MAG: hypothetical protein JXA57_07920 [Armatimonadetes bacterium]|nr:hypothetical protein [Armatimonadota bacterium]